MTRRILSMRFGDILFPVQARTSIPDAEEIWLIMDGELELFAQYGELVFCGI